MHVKGTPADKIFVASEELDVCRDEDVISDDALSSQADEAAIFNDAFSKGLYSPRGCEMLGRRFSEGDIASALAALTTKSRRARKIISHISIETSNLFMQ